MKKQLTTLLTLLFFILPVIASAQVFKYSNSLVNIPGAQAAQGFAGYVNLIYGLSISVAALLAVVKIVIAGVKWMLSDVVTDKGDAKKDIQSALFGLIIIISAVLIIDLINPDIVTTSP